MSIVKRVETFYLRVAQEFCEWDYSIIPVKPRTQKPCIRNWRDYLSRRPYAGEIRYWARTWTDAFPALVTEKGLIVDRAEFPDFCPDIPPDIIDAIFEIPGNLQKELDALCPSPAPSVEAVIPPADHVLTPPDISPSFRVSGLGVEEVSPPEIPPVQEATPPVESRGLIPGGPKSTDDPLPQGELANDHLVKEPFVKPVVRRRTVPPRKGTKADTSSIRISSVLTAGHVEPVETFALAEPALRKEIIPAPEKSFAGEDYTWIGLFRKSRHSRVFQDAYLWKLWTWGLMTASYKDEWVLLKIGKGSTTVFVKRGQFIFGRKSAARILKMKEHTVYKRMLKLESMGNWNIKSNTHYSIVTICNYEFYQRLVIGKGTPKGTAKEQPRNTYNKGEEREEVVKNKNKDKDTGKEAVASRPAPVSPPANDVEAVVRYWNEICGGILPKVQKIDDRRKATIRARLKEHRLPEWPKIFSLVMESPFLQGEGDRGWKADFNWVMKLSNLVKILEGNYSRTKAMSKRKRMMQATDEALQEYAKKIKLDNSDDSLTNALQIGSGRADEVSTNLIKSEPENPVIMCPVCQKETTRIDIEKLGCCPGCYRQRSPEVLQSIKDFNRTLNGKDPEKDSGHA